MSILYLPLVCFASGPQCFTYSHKCTFFDIKYYVHCTLGHLVNVFIKEKSRASPIGLAAFELRKVASPIGPATPISVASGHYNY